MAEKFALVIGIENYNEKRISPVKHAEADATGFAKVLQLHGFEPTNIQLVISAAATKTTIESHLRRLFARATEEDQIIIFYAGHGFAENDHNYLTCADTVRGDLVKTSVPLQKLLRKVRNSSCKRVLLFLDSCHSGFDIDESMRGILSDMTDDEFAEFLKDSQYHVLFAACNTDQYSYSTHHLGHGIWTYHIIEALKGSALSALERKRFLTADSLQVYLSKEVPRSVRKYLVGAEIQTPRVLGNASKAFIVADLEEILKKRAAARVPKLAQLKKVFLSGNVGGNVRSLKGFLPSHKVPKQVNGATEAFVSRIGSEDLKEYADDLFQELKSTFGFKRRDISMTDGDSSSSIITAAFTVNLWLGINPEDPSEYLITTEVTEIRDPSAIQSDGFNSVFSATFDSLTFQFGSKIDIEALIDAIEEIDDKELISVEYPADISTCSITISGLEAEIVVNKREFIVRHSSYVEPKKLIGSFNAAQKFLVGGHDIKLLPFH